VGGRAASRSPRRLNTSDQKLSSVKADPELNPGRRLRFDPDGDGVRRVLPTERSEVDRESRR
jgi:hypothetical protein